MNLFPPVPLATILTIFYKTTHECSIDYLEGADALVKYLTSSGLSEISIPPSLIPASYTYADLPPSNPLTYLVSWHILELARIFNNYDKHKRGAIFWLLVLLKAFISEAPTYGFANAR